MVALVARLAARVVALRAAARRRGERVLVARDDGLAHLERHVQRDQLEARVVPRLDVRGSGDDGEALRHQERVGRVQLDDAGGVGFDKGIAVGLEDRRYLGGGVRHWEKGFGWG